MTGKDFFESVNSHPELEGLDVTNDGGEDVVYVLHKPTATKYRLTFDAIATEDWGTLEAIMTGRREAHVMDHMTRVVGYYSRISNWNKSKVGELRGRHSGNYGVRNESSI